MPDTEISRLVELPAGLLDAEDVLAIVDDSASETKKIKATSLVSGTIDELPGDSIDPDKIDWDSTEDKVIDGSALKDRSIPAAKLELNSLTASEISANAIGSDELADGACDTTALQDDAVTADKLATDSVTADAVGDGEIGEDQLADSSVTYAKTNFNDGDIPGAKIESNSITASEIAKNAIGSSELADEACDTAAIKDDAVTADKLASGSVTADAVGDEEIGTDQLADSSVTYAKTNFSDGDIPGAKIESNSITATQIAENAIGSDELANSSVDTAALQDSSVTAIKLASDSVSSDNIINETIQTEDLSDGLITEDKLNANSVSTTKLQADSVTPSKLQNNLPASILETGSITSLYLANDACTTAKIDDAAITTDKLASSSVTDAKIDGVDGSKLVPDSVEASKFDPRAFAGGIELDGTVRHTNEITAATASGISWDAHGHIIGSVDLDADDMPIATDSQLGAIIVPAGSGLTVNAQGEIDHRTLIDAGLMSGITYDEHGHITATRALISTDLPTASNAAIGAVSVPTADSNPLLVNGEGALTHSQSVITPGTYASLEVDQYGHAISGSGVLTPGQVPGLDASKITTGEFSTAFIADNAITLAKLADYSISFIQEAEPSVQIQDLHIGVLWLQPSTAQLRMYDGNVWSPIGFGRLSQDNLRFCGTINADTGLITTLNDRGREAGFEVGEVPPTATDALGGAYLLVEVAGSSISVVPDTTFDAGDWCLCVNATEGWIRIDTITGGGGGGSALLRLNDLLDVDITNPLPGDSLIYDSETNNWVNRTTTVDRLTLSPAFDGTTTAFTLSDTCEDQNNLTLSLSGVIQEPGVDFTVTAGTNELRFASPPPTGSTYFVLSQQAIASSGGGGGGGTTLPPGTSENELLKWDNDLGAWTPSNIIEGGTY